MKSIKTILVSSVVLGAVLLSGCSGFVRPDHTKVQDVDCKGTVKIDLISAYSEIPLTKYNGDNGKYYSKGKAVFRMDGWHNPSAFEKIECKAPPLK